MNENEILFVTCVNDEKQYLVCKEYIRKLNIPFGYKVDLFPVRNALSMAQGYNQALIHKAKYKIYLHQDTFILNEYILHELLEIFQSDPNLGMMGTIGCKKIPDTGIWWEGKEILGKALIVLVKENQTVESVGREVHTSFEEVEAVDGYFMATQYDLPWREDIIPGFHFYDTSQSIEFLKNKYMVGIPRQVNYWCLHHVNHSIDLTTHNSLLGSFRQHYSDFYGR